MKVKVESARRNPNTRLDAIPAVCPAPPPTAAATVPHSDIAVNINIHPSIEMRLLTVIG
jgi:hypothetical protein